MSYLWKQGAALWNVWQTTHQQKNDVLMMRQSKYLKEFVHSTRNCSPFYRNFYRYVASQIGTLQELPPVTKTELIDHFDEWVTNPTITWAQLEKHLADKTLVSQPFLGKYLVYTSSGTTGHHAAFIQDDDAAITYRAMKMLGLGMQDLWAILQNGAKWAVIVATTEAPLGSVTGFRSMERTSSLKALFRRITLLSMTEPFTKIVQALNHYQPTVLIGYSSIIAELAYEQMAGRLQIDPKLVGIGAEWISAEKFQQIRTAFPKVRDTYAAAECPSIATSCEYGWLHSQSERVILEAVDERYQPVPVGQPSHTVLLTNLINRIQPIIRYDLGDSILIHPEPCFCGNPFPAMRVLGRKGEGLSLQTPTGEFQVVFPMPVIELLNHVPGVRRFQVIQTSPLQLKLRLQAATDANEEQVWQAAIAQIRAFLTGQGLSSIAIERSAEPPINDPQSGKYRYLWNEALPVS